MNLIDKVIFLLIKAGKPELCLSIMRIFPTPSRRKRTSLWGSGFSAWCTSIGYDGAVCVEVEDRAYEGSLEKQKLVLKQSYTYLRQFVPRM